MQDSVIQGFNCLRAEQRQLSAKVSELEQDLTEHKLVAEALTEVDSGRTCFRMIGGVLVERTVEEVLPSLLKNRQMIESLIEALKKQIVSKGQEIAQFVEKNNIQIRVQTTPDAARTSDSESVSVLVQ